MGSSNFCSLLLNASIDRKSWFSFQKSIHLNINSTWLLSPIHSIRICIKKIIICSFGRNAFNLLWSKTPQESTSNSKSAYSHVLTLCISLISIFPIAYFPPNINRYLSNIIFHVFHNTAFRLCPVGSKTTTQFQTTVLISV